MKIDIKYSRPDLIKLDFIEGSKSNWIDLRSAEDIKIQAGEFKMVCLGVAMKLPDGYEALIASRSSTFKNFGLLQVNSPGIVDNSYSGDEDWWHFLVYATRDTFVSFNDRICQFRIIKSQPSISFKEVEHLNSVNRGAFGSTGLK